MLLDIEVQKQHRGNRYAEKAVAGIVADAGKSESGTSSRAHVAGGKESARRPSMPTTERLRSMITLTPDQAARTRKAWAKM